MNQKGKVARKFWSANFFGLLFVLNNESIVHMRTYNHGLKKEAKISSLPSSHSYFHFFIHPVLERLSPAQVFPAQ